MCEAPFPKEVGVPETILPLSWGNFVERWYVKTLSLQAESKVTLPAWIFIILIEQWNVEIGLFLWVLQRA